MNAFPRQLVLLMLAVFTACTDIVHLTVDVAPEIVSVDPPTDSVGVSRAASVTVIFSERILPESVDEDSLIATAAGRRIPGSVTLVGSTLTFVADGPLPFLAEHVMTLSTRLLDADGSPHAVASFDWRFTSGDFEWTEVSAVSSTGGSAVTPRSAALGDGEFVTVWAQNDGPRYTIRAATFDEEGWSSPELIGPNVGLDGIDPRVASDGSGMAIAVWQQSDGAISDVWFNRFLAGFGWQVPRRLEASTENAMQARVAVAANGVATAVWIQSDGTRANLWGARYDPAGDTWSAAELLEMNSAGDAKDPFVTTDSRGTATVVWRQFGAPGRADLWSTRFVGGSGWTPPELIETNDSGNALAPVIAADDTGAALAVWPHADDTNTVYNAWASRFDPSIGWSAPTLLESYDAGSVSTGIPAVALFPDGRGIALWSQSTGGASTRSDIWFSQFDPNVGWTPRALLESNDVASATNPTAALDEFGSGNIVWIQHDGGHRSVWTARIVHDVLGNPMLVENDEGDAFLPDVAVDAAASAAVVWYQSDGVRTRIRGRVLR